VGRRFPVFHQGLCIRAATKSAPAGPRVDEVVLGDCPIRQGDLVLADRDGIAVVPKDRVREVLEASRERVRKEQVLMEGLGEGKTTLELLGLS
jgi:4-hydroxy-4-methyl-2-oxoglutarate aldolase